MFRGYNLSLSNADISLLGKIESMSLSKITDSLKVNKEEMKRKSDSLIDKGLLSASIQKSNEDLDGSKLSNEWFPSIHADIFISHSHKDEKLAIKLAAWLFQNFGLNCFIDSTVWGYSDELLKELDNHYCLNENGETYSYEKRNMTTSHVHMMLSTALNNMIDRSECLFFLNTKNSIIDDKLDPEDSDQTYSPWLYNEISTFNIVEKRNPRYSLEEVRKILLESEQSIEKRTEFNIRYKTDLSKLKKIGWLDLLRWQQSNENGVKGPETLDALYYILILEKIYEQ